MANKHEIIEHFEIDRGIINNYIPKQLLANHSDFIYCYILSKCKNRKEAVKLFLIRFLHQTTTTILRLLNACPLFLIRFLHQTTTRWKLRSSKKELFLIRFLHQTTTVRVSVNDAVPLFLIRFLHQTTTYGMLHQGNPLVVSYSISTSNHNIKTY